MWYFYTVVVVVFLIIFFSQMFSFMLKCIWLYMCMICLSINGIFIKSLFYALNPPFLTSLSKVASLHPSLIVAFTLFMLMCKCMVGFLLQWIFVSVICQCLIFNIFFSINTFLVPDICKKKKKSGWCCVSVRTSFLTLLAHFP